MTVSSIIYSDILTHMCARTCHTRNEQSLYFKSSMTHVELATCDIYHWLGDGAHASYTARKYHGAS